MTRDVLYISHNGLTEPLGRRQVIPYVVGLGRRGWRFHVVSFEKRETADRSACDAVRSSLAAGDITWTPLSYHRRPPVLATAYDIGVGVQRTVCFGQGGRLIHARSTVPAVIAAAAKWRLGTPWIFDVRGLLAREYADAGHWRANGLLYRMTDAIERRLMRNASGLVFLTGRIAAELADAQAVPPSTPYAIVPCVTDLEEFRRDPGARRRIRAALGIGDSPLLVYSGSVGSWYRLSEMAHFFRVAREMTANLRLLVLSPQLDAARQTLDAAGVGGLATVLSLRPEEVPSHLSAADAGICFVGDLASKRASSPTKYGEYLACGLPVITNPWTGDAAALRSIPGWILVERLDHAAYREGARALAALLARPAEAASAARALAEREFSLDAAVERYDRLYRRVLGEPA